MLLEWLSIIPIGAVVLLLWYGALVLRRKAPLVGPEVGSRGAARRA
jgi:hypothetical protein